MYTKNILAVSGLLISAVAAIPMKRDIEWVTMTEEAVVTVPVTTTVWVDATGAPNHNANPHYGHHHHSTLTSHIQQTVTVPSAPAYTPPAESSPVAPVESSPAPPSSTPEAPSSSSVYVPPPPPSTTSVYTPPPPPPAPTTTSTTEAAPVTTAAPTSTWEAPTTTSAAAPAYSAPSSGGSGLSSGLAAAGTDYTGDLTWYQTGMGACGWTSGDSDPIVAISHVIFDSYSAQEGGNPNNNPVCGKYVTITGVDGSPYQAKVVDRCVGCMEGDLDLSNGFFNTVTNNGNGRVHNMAWSWN